MKRLVSGSEDGIKYQAILYSDRVALSAERQGIKFTATIPVATMTFNRQIDEQLQNKISEKLRLLMEEVKANGISSTTNEAGQQTNNS